MTHYFSTKEWQQLGARAQARRCRVLAAEAQDWAKSTSPHMKEAIEDLAAQWAILAAEIEETTRDDLK
jgi:hypothetical protein